MITMTQIELAVRTHQAIGEPLDFSPDVVSRIIEETFNQIHAQAERGRGLVIDGVGEVVVVRKKQ